jgi:hypothetical protein
MEKLKDEIEVIRVNPNEMISINKEDNLKK